VREINKEVKRGDIYYVSGKESYGSEQAGNRPALIVSNEKCNKFSPVVEVVYLTAQLKKNMPTHVPINAAKRSIALCEQVHSVSKSRLESYVSHVTVAELEAIDKALLISLGLEKEKGMNEVKVVEKKTPIEIALGVDAEGMTTARKLYEFLELNPTHYARWCKKNILENEFAEENIDYWTFAIDGERDFNPNPTTDYKLTAKFAKKLSMTARNEKGEEARDYFIKMESSVKMVAESIDRLSPELRLLISLELKQKEQNNKLEQLDAKIDSIKEVVALNTNSWRKDSAAIINKIALSLGGYEHINVIRKDSYQLLEQRMGVALNIRLTNKKKTMLLNGVCKSKIDKFNQLDVIADDKKLIEGYLAIIKEMAIKYGAA